jgi:hypothetical protein
MSEHLQAESHASDAERQAKDAYSDAVEREAILYATELKQVNGGHEVRLLAISGTYTDALAAARQQGTDPTADDPASVA